MGRVGPLSAPVSALPPTDVGPVLERRLGLVDAIMLVVGSMIGSGQGIVDLAAIRRIVERVSVPVVVDAGIGTASDAALAMEAGVDACLINTAISRAEHPVAMAAAMRHAVAAGRLSYLAGRMPISDVASPSSPASDLVTAGQ